MALNYIVWNVDPFIFQFPLPDFLGGEYRPIAWYGVLWAMVFLVMMITKI